MPAPVWVLLWADQVSEPTRVQCVRAIADERLAHDELHAPRPPPRAPDLLRRAAEAYQGMRFAEARERYDEAIAEAVASGASGLGAADLGDLYLGRALALEASGASGFDDFVRAARIAPARLLDPARAPPGAMQSFARAQEIVRVSSRGALVVEAPSGAAVFLDGDPVGRAPLRIADLPHGERLVRVEAPGRLPAAARVVHAGVETRVRLDGELAGPPALGALLEEARRRGAKTALIVTVRAAGDIVVERVAVAAGRVDAVERTGAADLRGALRRLLAPPPPSDRPRTWALLAGGVLAGAAIATMVILLGGDDGRGVQVSVQPPGEHPR
jgi:PEGA domain-containing protein